MLPNCPKPRCKTVTFPCWVLLRIVHTCQVQNVILHQGLCQQMEKKLFSSWPMAN
ncbi:hypothetical protein PAMA_021773 [Pampus argenteus]